MIGVEKIDGWWYLTSNGVCLYGIGYYSADAAYESEAYKFFSELMD